MFCETACMTIKVQPSVLIFENQFASEEIARYQESLLINSLIEPDISLVNSHVKL